MNIEDRSSTTLNRDTVIIISQDELEKLRNGDVLYQEYLGGNVYLKAVISSTAPA